MLPPGQQANLQLSWIKLDVWSHQLQSAVYAMNLLSSQAPRTHAIIFLLMLFTL